MSNCCSFVQFLKHILKLDKCAHARKNYHPLKFWAKKTVLNTPLLHSFGFNRISSVKQEDFNVNCPMRNKVGCRISLGWWSGDWWTQVF